MSKITKEQIIEDVKKINDQYLAEYPDSIFMTRDYYRGHGKFKETQVNKLFSSFENLKKEILGDLDIINYKKKLCILEEKNRALEQENTKLIKNTVAEDSILELYENALNNIPQVKINNATISIKDDKNRVAILQLSDAHIGEIVAPQFVNGVNEYNEKVCLRRLDTVFNVFLAYCNKFKITKCHILLNGDMLSGGIHTELVRNMWCNEVEQLFFAQQYFIQKLSYISEFFNRIDVSVIVGNHSRVLQGKPYHKEKVTMNFEYILGRQLKMYFETLSDQKKNTKIFIDVPESAFKIINVNETRFLITHGDILMGAGSGGFAGIPFYSICMSAAKLYGVLHQINVTKDVQFDHILCGHLHTSTRIPLFNGGSCFVNGAIIGTNEFSLTKMKSVAKQEQLMLIIDSHGRIELEKNIIFD